MALRVELPDVINPAEDWCIPVYIPADTGYLMALRSVLTLLSRWHAWERDDAKQGTLAAQRWEQADAKTIAAILAGQRCGDACEDCEDCEDCENSVIVDSQMGGITVIGGDNVGQVVTDVYIDSDTGKLVVKFGHCCEETYSIQALSGGTFQDEETAIEPPDPAPAGDYTPCGKSHALWSVWVDVVDALLDGAENIQSPWAVANVLSVKYPSIKFGKTALANGLTSAFGVVAQGYASETEGAAQLAEVLCAGVGYFTSGYDGCTFDQYRSWVKMVSVKANSFFDIDSYPTAFGFMASVWFWAAESIGDSDAKDITTGAIDNGLVCCPSHFVIAPEGTPPDVSGWYLSPDFAGDMVFYTEGGTWDIWGAAPSVEHDVYAAVFKIDATPAGGNVKRMNWDNSEGPEGQLPAADASFTESSSDSLQDKQVDKFFIICDTVANADIIAALLGLTTYNHLPQSAADMDVIGVPGYPGGGTLGFRLDVDEDQTFEIQELHWVHNVNSPSHSA